MFEFIKKYVSKSDKKVVEFVWIDPKSLRLGSPAKVLTLKNAMANPSNSNYLAKQTTSKVTFISDSAFEFETENTKYVQKHIPYLSALITNKIPILTEVVEN